MTILLVDAAGRPLTATWCNADGTVTRVDGGEAREPEAQSYDVEFFEVATGSTARVAYNMPWGEGSTYHWTDGNMGCDCNRALEFWRAQHPAATLEEEPDFECGDGKYRVTIRNDDRILHNEMEGAC